ncbi:MAG: hypothetical protein IPH75_16375 [bacterium]|nr:hypothetical protein [bacterium]
MPLRDFKNSLFSFKWAFRSSKKEELADDDEHIVRKPEPKKIEEFDDEEAEPLDLFDERADKPAKRRTTVKKAPETDSGHIL